MSMRLHSRVRTELPTALLLAVPLLLACAGPKPGAPVTSERVTPPVPESSVPQPTLVVFLVVDQLRGDLLDRYASVFDGGFKRLLEGGHVFTRALFDHAATQTAPGHAALSTAVQPGRAGVPSNSWRERVDGETLPVYNVIDPEESLTGIPGFPGASPKVLLREGLADWIRNAHPEARVVSVSGKARAAVLMAGRGLGDVIWFDSQAGRFVTSTFYHETNPPWLDRFNEAVLPTYRADSVWMSTVPPAARDLSAADTAAFEGDGVHTFFPHRYHSERPNPGVDDFFRWLETTPMLDRATLEVALLAAEKEGLGQVPGRTDFLSVSFSQVDRVGHAYGPLSREQMDNLLRLDRTLERLLEHLDRAVGPENYVLGLTGDHGVLTMPERLEKSKGRRLTLEDRGRMEAVLGRALNRTGREEGGGPAPLLIEAMEGLPFVGPAYSHDELLSGQPGDSLEVFFRHSFYPGRAGGLLSLYGVEMWWEENVLDWSLPTGTTHGSPYYYDRWVPMIVWGPGVEIGRWDDPVRPLDLGPTLAQLAGIPFPRDLDGQPRPVR